MARAIERVRADKVALDGREALPSLCWSDCWRSFVRNSSVSALSGRGQEIKRASCGPAPASRASSMRHPSAAGRPFDFGKIEAANIMSMGCRTKQICGDGLSSETGPR